MDVPTPTPYADRDFVSFVKFVRGQITLIMQTNKSKYPFFAPLKQEDAFFPYFSPLGRARSLLMLGWLLVPRRSCFFPP